MPEARPPRPAGPAGPAIGGGGRLPRRVLGLRYSLVLAVLLLLVLVKIAVAQQVTTVATLTPPKHVVTSALVIGNAPTDTDLVELAADLKVDGIVALGDPSVAEQATAASLHEGYLYLPILPNDSPTWNQLRQLAAFLRRHTAGGSSVYLHDDVGGGRATVAVEMLLMLRGESMSAATAEMTPGERGSMCNCQRLALRELASALHPAGQVLTSNPYAAAVLDPW